MLLLALVLPPLALYLIVLGWVNRRPRPMMTAGAWDFVGVLLGLSGFLLFGGPALLGSLDEQSRWYWLLGPAGSSAAAAGDGRAWLVVRLTYFAAVAGAAALVIWRARRLTSIYNVDPPSVFSALELASKRLGLHALRVGDALVIGRDADQTAGGKAFGLPAAAPPTRPGATVSVDLFPVMRHATLRWKSADAALRRDLERELTRLLAEAAPPGTDSALGGALCLVGVTLLVLALAAAGFLLLVRIYPPR